MEDLLRTVDSSSEHPVCGIYFEALAYIFNSARRCSCGETQDTLNIVLLGKPGNLEIVWSEAVSPLPNSHIQCLVNNVV